MKKGILIGLVYLSASFTMASAETQAESSALTIPPQSIEGDTAIVANTADSIDADIVQAAQNATKSNAKESEIPLFQNSKEAAQKPEMTSVSRLAFSFAIVLLAGVGALFFGKWWGKRNSRNEINTQMRVMTQFHIGPRKTLAIVRVAGEFILLGITDQNINMLKTLSLIDDEYPEGNKGFNETLSEKSDSDDKDDFVLGSIKDVVGKKLKDFRTL